MKITIKHKWDVDVPEARRIQEKLCEKWVAEDRLGNIRMVAGLDAAFLLTGSQALKTKRSGWRGLQDANQAIAAVVVYKYPEMQEIERVTRCCRCSSRTSRDF